MSENNDGWVLVESEDELRPGLNIKERPCSTCRKTHYTVLKSSVGISWNVSSEKTSKELWTITPGVDCCPSGKILFGRSIRNRSLYRLADPDITDEYRVTSKAVFKQEIENLIRLLQR